VEFEFISDNLALDFAGTLMWREATPSERLTSPAALGRWSKAAGLVDSGTATDRAGFASALELREAVYRSARAVLDEENPAAGDLRLINRVAAAPPVKTRLLGVGRRARQGDLDGVLSTIARSAIDLIGGEDRLRLRGCLGSDCSRLFVDRSRAGSRRWCGMESCGSKAKSAAYRRRKRDLSSP
jgi:predicted RNA-binding Zn ribbon-like protein